MYVSVERKEEKNICNQVLNTNNGQKKKKNQWHCVDTKEPTTTSSPYQAKTFKQLI